MRFCLCLLGVVSPYQYCKVDPGCSQTVGSYPQTILDDIPQQERMDNWTYRGAINSIQRNVRCSRIKPTRARSIESKQGCLGGFNGRPSKPYFNFHKSRTSKVRYFEACRCSGVSSIQTTSNKSVNCVLEQ